MSVKGAVRTLAPAGVVALLAACAGSPPPAPPPVPAPTGSLEAPILDREGGVVLTPPPRIPVSPGDPILSTSLADDPEVIRRIRYWILRWQFTWDEHFPRYLARMDRHVGMVDSLVAERGLPPSLRYLPIVESGYNPAAASRAGAVGMWQFMRGTARFRGLRVTALVDERREPLRSTEEALDYLAELNQKFGGSWFLALAAYNGGPGRVERILRRHARGVRPSDSLFWALRDRFPSETRDFVPKLLAAARIAADPHRYGFVVDEEARPPAAERVVVPDATSLDVVARAAEVSPREVEILNPHLRRGYTPPGSETTVWVPEGAAERFRQRFPEIPPGERVSFVEHRLRRGETLSHVAYRYGVSLSELRGANPGLDPRRLQIGQWVTVPRAPDARVAAVARLRPTTRAAPEVGGGSGDGAGEASPGVHRIRRGDTLWEIARAYGVGLEELRALNDVEDGRALRPGDELRLPDGRALVYRVRPGDTVSGIAYRHGVATDVVLRLNGLRRGSVIRPGDRIRLPGAGSGS